MIAARPCEEDREKDGGPMKPALAVLVIAIAAPLAWAQSGPDHWNEDLVLQRYELLHEAGLVPEAGRPVADAVPGMPMRHDHRRILATGIARLRICIRKCA